MPLSLNENTTDRLLNKKIRLTVILVSITFLFLFFRLGYLQILKGLKYNALSSNNRIRVSKTVDPRGIIFSKQQEVLVKNIPSFDLSLIPQDTPDANAVLNSISSLLHLDRKELTERLLKKKNRPPFEPITLKKELRWNEMSLVLSKKMELQGISVAVVPKRFYSLGTFAPHVFGFLGEINRKELKQRTEQDYSLGDLVGKYGLEKWGERYLKGKKGGLQTEVDVFGNRQNLLAEIDPVPGCDIIIALVPELQKITEDLLRGKTGAVVAMDPASGEILVLASSPGFDSNLFSRGINPKDWSALLKNKYHPLLNRAIQSQQPPGSIFKIITSIAALEEGQVDPEAKIFCPGHYKLGIRQFNCWKKGGHGWMTMKDALVESCDTYFYNISLRIGIDSIVKYARLLGIGVKTGIELEDEKAGLLPSPEWKKEKHGKIWQKGETLNMAIGQGFLLSTPLQIAVIVSGLVNNGIIPKPRLVLKIACQDSEIFFPFKKIGAYTLSSKTISFMKTALADVVNAPKGTGSRAKIKGIIVAGKTGTSQVASKKNIKGEEKDIPYHLRDHAWFVAFAPVEKPEIVVSVLVEHGGSGGQVAAPIAQKIISAYLKP